MAEFLQIATIARALFLPEVIPWSKLLTESSLEKLRSRYKLDQVMPVPPMTGLIGASGTPAVGISPQIFSPKGEFDAGGNVLLIEQLIIQPAIVQVQIDGDSERAAQFLEDLGNFFLEIDSDRHYSEKGQLTRSYQTIAVVKLSFPVSALFSERFSRYLDETVTPRLTPQDTNIEIRLSTMRWVVSYRPNKPDFTYLPKLLAIEPRQGSRPSDMLYFTQSPADFKTHKELLESLEKALA